MNTSDTSKTNELSSAGTKADLERQYLGMDGRISFRRRLRRVLWHLLARQISLGCMIATTITSWIGRGNRPIDGDGCDILLTGRFDSYNWILNHIGPLSSSEKCLQLWMVSTNPVPAIPKVIPVYPSKWLIAILGATSARLLTFLWVAIRRSPHLVGGFHMIPNGMLASVAARMVGAKSIYFCVGGPAEVSDGGILCEGGFGNMETADALVEKRLMWIASRFDTIVTMGTRAVDFFQDKGVDTDFHVVSGGIDPDRFKPRGERTSIDLIWVGRVVEIKRTDILLCAIRLVVQRMPNLKAVILGDGELLDQSRRLAQYLGIEKNVEFAGHQAAVESWLCKSRVFVLTSDSEGLSLSMMEAMMCGLPAIVSDVGDLADLVEDGVNGYLVPRGSSDVFADRILDLLSDTEKLAEFSRAARRSALRYETQATICLWDDIIAGY